MKRGQQAMVNVLIFQPLIRAMVEAEGRMILGIEWDRGHVERQVMKTTRELYAKRLRGRRRCA